MVIHHTGIDDPVQAAMVDASHAKRGYSSSLRGSHIAYHFLIGKDGTVKQNRAMSERTGHTRNGEVNRHSIAIAVAGDFTREAPTPAQLSALRDLVAKLDTAYQFERIMGHRSASPTSCPGDRLLEKIPDLLRKA